jgi:hypothetical protein
VESFDKILTVRKGKEMITFHKKLPLGMSFLPCVDLLGHVSIENTRKIALRLGLKFTGSISTCDDCLLTKIRRKTSTK